MHIGSPIFLFTAYSIPQRVAHAAEPASTVWSGALTNAPPLAQRANRVPDQAAVADQPSHDVQSAARRCTTVTAADVAATGRDCHLHPQPLRMRPAPRSRVSMYHAAPDSAPASPRPPTMLHFLPARAPDGTPREQRSHDQSSWTSRPLDCRSLMYAAAASAPILPCAAIASWSAATTSRPIAVPPQM